MGIVAVKHPGEERRWVCDSTAPNTTFVDGYFLSGMTLPAHRIWRLSVGPADFEAAHAQVANPAAAIKSTNASGLLAVLLNADGSTTEIFFPQGTVAKAGTTSVTSHAGLWLLQPSSAALPIRSQAGSVQAFCENASGPFASVDWSATSGGAPVLKSDDLSSQGSSKARDRTLAPMPAPDPINTAPFTVFDSFSVCGAEWIAPNASSVERFGAARRGRRRHSAAQCPGPRYRW
jgi:hypothetical protein